ncbi:RNA-directed DNA polymerase, eukaryota [Tanacetum coccineum]
MGWRNSSYGRFKRGLIDIPLEGYSFTWAHKSASKMSKLDRNRYLTLVSFLSVCFILDSLFSSFVVTTWNAMNIIEPNGLIRMKKKLQLLKSTIKVWSKEARSRTREKKTIIHHKLSEVDKIIDQGICNDDVISIRTNLLNEIQELNSLDAVEISQKAKIRWTIEGDENTKYFHGILNKKRSQLASHGTLVNGDWISNPDGVKHEFLSHFRKQFSPPDSPRFCFDYVFPNRLSSDQVEDLECNVTYEKVKRAVWDCGTNKLPGPDGFTFESFREFWATIDQDVFQAVLEFFESGLIPRGCNASFISLIPKIQDAKLVKDFRPISLIRSIYKIITKILANRLCLVLPSIISEIQSAFVSNCNILDGSFLLNELLSWCKHKNRSALIFKVDSEKAADSVKWVYLLDTLQAFGFGKKWWNWINGCLQTATGSVLVNGSPSSEFQFFKGLKQGDPISPFLFILIMETLHLSFSRVINAGLFKGISINQSFSISHLFYADDAVFVNSKLMGVGINLNEVVRAVNSIGCSTFSTPFKYLGVIVGDNMSRVSSWDDIIYKVSNRLSKWKLKSLLIGGRLTLLKSVLSYISLYHMSIYKVPIGVLSKLESIRRNFFNGVDGSENKIAWIGWDKVLSSKKNGGLGVSSYYASNRALLFKWVWRFFTQESSWWSRFIKVVHGNQGAIDSRIMSSRGSLWLDIIRDLFSMKSKGIDLMQFMRKKIGNGENTSFWNDPWLPRGGVEEEQVSLLCHRINDVILPNMSACWIWSLDGSGLFSVKSARRVINNTLFPKVDIPNRWVKIIPIKVNIHAWRVCLDKIPTTLNLSIRGIDIPSILCPL